MQIEALTQDSGENSFFSSFFNFSWDCCFITASYRYPFSTVLSPSYSCITFIGTSLYNHAGLQDLGYYWHPTSSECKAEWICRTRRIRKKTVKQCNSQDLYKLLTAPLTTWNIRPQMAEMEYCTVLLQRHLKAFMNNTQRSPPRALAHWHLKYKNRIHGGLLTKQ